MTSSDPPLLRLPLEVTDNIADELRNNRDLMAFASTCPSIAERYYLPAVASRLSQEFQRPDPEAADDAETLQVPRLYCLSNAVEGEPGYAPFFISSAVLSPDRTQIAVSMTSPVYDEFRPNIPTSSYIFTDSSGDTPPLSVIGRCGVLDLFNEYGSQLEELYNGEFVTEAVDIKYWNGELRDAARRAPIERDLDVNTETVDWRQAMAGSIVPASFELLAERFTCMECDGTGQVIVTPGAKILRRWPDLIRDVDVPDDNLPPYEFDIRCPRCKGYAAAVDQLDDMLGEFEDSLPERMEEFDAMMQEMYEDGEYEY